MESKLTDDQTNWDHINFGELGRDWWFESGATVGATTQQVIFSVCRHNGMTMTGSAKMAQYSGDETTIRQSGHRASSRDRQGTRRQRYYD